MSNDPNMLGERLDWLKEILRDAETSSQLSNWEETFLDDMRERVLRFAGRTFVSARQMEILQRIETKLYR